MISSGITAYAANVARCAKMAVISSALKTRGVWANSQGFSRSNEGDQNGPMLIPAIPASPADDFLCRVLEKRLIECNGADCAVQRARAIAFAVELRDACRISTLPLPRPAL